MTDIVKFLFGELPFDKREPDAVNEMGVKFWFDPDLTQYAKQKGLKNVQVFFVEHDGKKFRGIAQDGQLVFESTRYEDTCFHIDIMAAYEQMS